MTEYNYSTFDMTREEPLFEAFPERNFGRCGVNVADGYGDPPR